MARELKEDGNLGGGKDEGWDEIMGEEEIIEESFLFWDYDDLQLCGF